jgi:predicted small integral membrane protein
LIEARIAKIAMVGLLAAFALLASYNNLADYDTNYQFVSHVPGMDTTFPGNGMLHRQLTWPALWQPAYALIMLCEGLSGLCLAVAAAALLRHLRSDAVQFNRAKRFVQIGTALAFFVWFFGFMVIGGEWFQMLQSQTWNGQQAAFRIYMTVLAMLIFVNQIDADLVPRTGT